MGTVRYTLFCLVAAWLAVTASPTLQAQLVDDGQTAILDGVVTNVPGDLTVGVNGSFTLLTLTNGTVLTNSGVVVIGTNVIAQSNSVLVTSTGSMWSCTGNLTVGDWGSFNALRIGNGGKIANYSSGIGNSISGSNNLAVVTDSGSLWTMQGILQVGAYASFNQLVVTNGAKVEGSVGSLGVILSSSNNIAIVTGSGSVWTNQSHLYVGDNGRFNLLLVTNGGRVANDAGFIGNLISGRNNRAIVTGEGSFWTNSRDLCVGCTASLNQLVVSNGGTVANRSGSIGKSSSDNIAIVTGSSSLWTNRLDLTVGISNLLIVTNGGRIVNASGHVDRSSRVIVTGAGSEWTNRLSFLVGTSNELTVSAGGKLISGSSTLGDYGNRNLAVVTGTGSLWATGDFQIGGNGSHNQLIVSNGAVVASGRFFVGASSSFSNKAVITGAGSLLNSLELSVGEGGSSNQFVIVDSGTVAVGSGFVGSGSTSVRNGVVIAGAGSIWTNTYDFTLGSRGGGVNQLTVTNGGTMASANGYMGYNATSFSNVAVIAGTDALWTNRGDFLVGRDGWASQLLVKDSGTVATRNFYVGFSSTSTSNLVTLTGGNIVVANSNGDGIADVRRGTLALNSGVFTADTLFLTNGPLSKLNFNGGTLQARNSTIQNGAVLVIGNGSSAATFDLLGGGSHTIGNGLLISSNALLSGGGTITGNVSVARGGLISPVRPLGNSPFVAV